MTRVKYAPANYRKNHFGFNNIFDEFFGKDLSQFRGHDSAASTPAINVRESDKDFTIEVAAPGYSKENLTLNVEDKVLTIEGKREEEKSEEGTKFNRKEFSYGSFKRSFKVSSEVNAEGISASYENGILNVVVPKAEEDKKVTKISIS